MIPQAKTGLLWAGVVVAAALVTGQAEAAGSLAIRCQVRVEVDTEAPKNWEIFMGNFIPGSTGGFNVSFRYYEPATGELGSGSAQLEPLRIDPVTGNPSPVGTTFVAKGSPRSGNVRERMYRGEYKIDPTTGVFSAVGVEVPSGDVQSIVTTGTTFVYQTRTFRIPAGTCVLTEDP